MTVVEKKVWSKVVASLIHSIHFLGLCYAGSSFHLLQYDFICLFEAVLLMCNGDISGSAWNILYESV